MRSAFLVTLGLLTLGALVPVASADVNLVLVCTESDLSADHHCVQSTYVPSAGAFCAGTLNNGRHVVVVCAGELDCPVYVDPVFLTDGRGLCL